MDKLVLYDDLHNELELTSYEKAVENMAQDRKKAFKVEVHNPPSNVYTTNVYNPPSDVYTIDVVEGVPEWVMECPYMGSSDDPDTKRHVKIDFFGDYHGRGGVFKEIPRKIFGDCYLDPKYRPSSCDHNQRQRENIGQVKRVLKRLDNDFESRWGGINDNFLYGVYIRVIECNDDQTEEFGEAIYYKHDFETDFNQQINDKFEDLRVRHALKVAGVNHEWMLALFAYYDAQDKPITLLDFYSKIGDLRDYLWIPGEEDNRIERFNDKYKESKRLIESTGWARSGCTWYQRFEDASLWYPSPTVMEKKCDDYNKESRELRKLLKNLEPPYITSQTKAGLYWKTYWVGRKKDDMSLEVTFHRASKHLPIDVIDHASIHSYNSEAFESHHPELTKALIEAGWRVGYYPHRDHQL